MRDLWAGRDVVTAPVLLLKFGGEGIVSSAETLPFGSDNNRFRSVDYPIRVFSENNSKSGLEMPLLSKSVKLGGAVVDGSFGREERT
jgi:hypothetical protein